MIPSEIIRTLLPELLIGAQLEEGVWIPPQHFALLLIQTESDYSNFVTSFNPESDSAKTIKATIEEKIEDGSIPKEWGEDVLRIYFSKESREHIATFLDEQDRNIRQPHRREKNYNNALLEDIADSPLDVDDLAFIFSEVFLGRYLKDRLYFGGFFGEQNVYNMEAELYSSKVTNKRTGALMGSEIAVKELADNLINLLDIIDEQSKNSESNPDKPCTIASRYHDFKRLTESENEVISAMANGAISVLSAKHHALRITRRNVVRIVFHEILQGKSSYAALANAMNDLHDLLHHTVITINGEWGKILNTCFEAGLDAK